MLQDPHGYKYWQCYISPELEAAAVNIATLRLSTAAAVLQAVPTVAGAGALAAGWDVAGGLTTRGLPAPGITIWGLAAGA